MTTRRLLTVALGGAMALAGAVAGWEQAHARSLAEARRALRPGLFSIGVLLLDGRHTPCDALDAFLREHWQLQWIAVLPPALMEQGPWRLLVHDHCCDFHTLPVDPGRLAHTLGHAHGMASLRAAPPPKAVASAPALAALTGQSAAIARLRRQIAKVAANSAPVLIWGESGSGKELAAQAVHAQSPRAAGPFVPINCGAMPASLIQSELFGYERGAFTGALREKRGLIEAAGGGSIFLDEIADLPLELQANLLRFLQEKTIHRLGATHSVQVDVRVIAASHVNLQTAVARGSFREDLYYRLNVLALDVPSLRERRDDLVPLAEHFFDAYALERAPRVKGFSSAALHAIRRHDWPGNVRELINRVRRAMVMAEGARITVQDLGLETGLETGQGAGAAVRGGGNMHGEALDDARVRAERDAISASLQRAGRNVSLAARELGVSRMTLYRLLSKHGMAAPSAPARAAVSHAPVTRAPISRAPVSHACDSLTAPPAARAIRVK